MSVLNLKKNFNALQLLRAIAVLLVVFHHSYRILLKGNDIEYPFFDLFEYAALGVDLFFVLSGFIMVYIHYSDIGKGVESLNTFLFKRIVRIYPIYWIVTIGYMLIRYLLGGETFSAGFTVNSFLLLPDTIQPILGVAWSLRHEMLFYLIFSLVIFNKKFSYLAIAWTLGMFVFLIQPMSFSESPYLNLLFDPINLEFLLGCMAAFLFLKGKWKFKWLITLGIVSFAVSITLQYFGITDFHRTIAWGIPSFLLILGLVNLDIKQDIKTPRSFVFLGDASYSIYLTHLVTIYIFGGAISKFNLFELASPLLVVLGFIVLQVALGCLFYLIVEKPTIKYFKSKLSRNKRRIKDVNVTA